LDNLGQCYAWGTATNGLLGNNQTAAAASTPIAICMGARTFCQVAVGQLNVFALDKDGKIVNGWDYKGIDSKELKQFKKAKEFLEMGLDYLVNNRVLEINFNIQLGESYNGLGDFKKKEAYFTKANQLLKK
jgi:alpha-tubulin suppressor-like RCC1 family protein